jgi:hypothetical protein
MYHDRFILLRQTPASLPMNRYLPLILTGVLPNACAQLALKQGMRNIGHFSFALVNLMTMGLKVTVNPFVLNGLACYVLGVVVWLVVLSPVETSFANPMLSVGYIVSELHIAEFNLINENSIALIQTGQLRAINCQASGLLRDLCSVRP